MLRAAAILAALIALAAPSRGDAGPSDASPPLTFTVHSGPPRTVTILRWTLSPLGLTDSRARTVWIDNTLTGTALRTVCAHELGHVLAGPAHETDLACWMRPSVSRDTAPTWWPCDAELARASGTYRISIPATLPGNVRRGIRWGIATWNCALKRDALVEAR